MGPYTFDIAMLHDWWNGYGRHHRMSYYVSTLGLTQLNNGGSVAFYPNPISQWFTEVDAFLLFPYINLAGKEICVVVT